MEGNVADAACCQDWEEVRRRVACGYDVNEIASKSGYFYPCSKGTALHYSLLNGQVEISELLLKRGANISAADGNGRQPLHLAAAAVDNSVGVCQLLFDCGADITAVEAYGDAYGETPLHVVASRRKECPEVCKLLLKHSAKVDALNSYGKTSLHLACEKGYADTVCLLLSHSADVRAVDRDGKTPLHIAASRQKECSEVCSEVCKILLECGAKVDALNEYGQTSLHLACRNGHTNTSSLLLSHGANVRAVDHVGQTPLLLINKHITGSQTGVDTQGNHALHIASRYGMSTAVQLLVNLGADTNSTNKLEQRPLHMAADREKDCPELCEILLKHAAKIDAVDEDGNQPLHLACNRGHTNTSILLLSHGADVRAVDHVGHTSLLLISKHITGSQTGVDTQGNHALHIASRDGMSTAVQLLVNLGADTNAMNKHGQRPLHMAADREKDCPELCEILLNHAAKIDVVDEDGNQPLHLVCKRDHTNAGSLLLSHGAATNAVNKHGQTPLHMAADREKDCPELCEILLKHGAKIDAVDEDGNQPLHLVCKRDHTNAGSLLLSHGAATNAVNKHGQTALHVVAGRGKRTQNMCKILFKYGAQLDIADKDGKQPLHVACERGSVTVGELLLSSGADVQALDSHGNMPQLSKLLMIALKNGSVSTCQLFLDKGANPNYIGEDGLQPLTVAVKRVNRELCHLLYDKGATLSIDGRKELSGALRHAIDWNLTDLTTLFLSRGLNIRDARIGQLTALEQSELTGTRDMVRLLHAAGNRLHLCKCAFRMNRH